MTYQELQGILNGSTAAFSAGASAGAQGQHVLLAQRAQAEHEQQMQQDAIIRAAQNARQQAAADRIAGDDAKRDEFMRGLNQDYGMGLLQNLQPTAEPAAPNLTAPPEMDLSAYTLNPRIAAQDAIAQAATTATPTVDAAMNPRQPYGPLRTNPVDMTAAAQNHLKDLGFEDYQRMQHQLAGERVAAQRADDMGTIADARLAAATRMANGELGGGPRANGTPDFITLPDGRKASVLGNTMRILNNPDIPLPENTVQFPDSSVHFVPAAPSNAPEETAYLKARDNWREKVSKLASRVAYAETDTDPAGKATLPAKKAELAQALKEGEPTREQFGRKKPATSGTSTNGVKTITLDQLRSKK